MAKSCGHLVPPNVSRHAMFPLLALDFLPVDCEWCTITLSFQAHLYIIGHVWRPCFPNFLLEWLLGEQSICMSLGFYPNISKNAEIWQGKERNVAFSLSDHSVNVVAEWTWESDRPGWSAQLTLLGCGSREMISAPHVPLLSFLSGSSERLPLHFLSTQFCS